MTEPRMTREQFERDDFNDRCLFTGAPIEGKKKGEHVIPRWLIADYGLQNQRIEMGDAVHQATMKDFRSPADPVANGKFGDLENKIKCGLASIDELHLWQKKISTGMALNHWRMARNVRHPGAPLPFDARYLAFALQDFRKEFGEYLEGRYVRTGSTLCLPTRIPSGWLVHAFGTTVREHDASHDALLPFGLVALSHCGQLIVSVLFDARRRFEALRLKQEWSALRLDVSESPLPIQAALAVGLTECITAASETAFGEPPAFDPLFEHIAYQLGIEVDPATAQYRARAAR
ncbi:hypothetical protein LGM89_07490 [Burkholderia sp. AU31624]|uniref:hypothetical protein n=1 Tax=Burkholderia sp. AU31624 TaxID=2879629 RepID=UPI001CF59EB1|nr:hypothetical protein [Burkholderia sp. AU31624]MCA8253101.1 hypothetical protein [Burkholderia sp. AU31624]